MGLNKPSGNMYPWAWTWNPEAGECCHGCHYCFVTLKIKNINQLLNKKYSGNTKIIEKELKTKLVKPNDGKIIFVESCGDLFGKWVPKDDITRILDHCKKYPNNCYLFQSKNPGRFFEFLQKMPPSHILGTTIETNRIKSFTKNWAIAPPNQMERISIIHTIKTMKHHTMISLEPITDFDLIPLVKIIMFANPDFISIGADSQKSNLDEPEPDKIKEFIKCIQNSNIEIRIKKNLKRLLSDDDKKNNYKNIGCSSNETNEKLKDIYNKSNKIQKNKSF